MHVKPTLQALATTLFLLATTTAAPVAELTTRASAEISTRGECTLGILCEMVNNDRRSDNSLKVTSDRGKRNSGAWFWIAPGGTSTTLIRDADGPYVEPGCLATSAEDVVRWGAGKWHKINGLQEATIKILC